MPEETTSSKEVVSEPDAARELTDGLRTVKRDAASKMVELFYPELRKLAVARMAGERSDHTWQPTVLVNELYLELIRIKALPAGVSDSQQQTEFLRFAGFLMKRLLAHHARPLRKRVTQVVVDDALALGASKKEDLQEIEDLLNKLAAVDPVLRTVVEMKVFEGLTREQIAERLGCSVRTVARHWEFAQHWLREYMTPDRRLVPDFSHD